MNVSLLRLQSVCLAQLQVTRNLASFRNLFGKNKDADNKKKKNEFDEENDEVNEKMAQTTEFTSLTDRSGSRLVRHKAYRPAGDVEDAIKNLCKETLRDDFNEMTYTSLKLDDPLTKFRLLSGCIKHFEHNISNTTLNDIKTVSDLISYYLTEVKNTNTLEDIQQATDLPKNLHITLDYKRFDPKTDTFFDGKDAYSDRDTVVTSLWYSKKYAGVKKEKEFFKK